jgi:hypothetical protein
MHEPEGGGADYYGPITACEPYGGGGGGDVITIEYGPEEDSFGGYRCTPYGDEGEWGPPGS